MRGAFPPEMPIPENTLTTASKSRVEAAAWFARLPRCFRGSQLSNKSTDQTKLDTYYFPIFFNRACEPIRGPLVPDEQHNRIAIFIDGRNLYATAKALGFDIDYKRLLKEFQSRGTVLRAFYYTAIVEDQDYSSIRPLIDWLDYNGYTVITKATKEFIDASGRRKMKGNMDIELTVDAMELAAHVDQIVLFSGDGDFRSLVEAVQRRGVRVTVVSSILSQPPMIADELRRQADVFTDLVELKSKLGRDQ
jgi:uncharacterized LabA/DUF88 family protein